MKTMTCDGCGRRVARVDDDRYAILPSATLCPTCAHPAYASLLHLGVVA